MYNALRLRREILELFVEAGRLGSQLRDARRHLPVRVGKLSPGLSLARHEWFLPDVAEVAAWQEQWVAAELCELMGVPALQHNLISLGMAMRDLGWKKRREYRMVGGEPKQVCVWRKAHGPRPGRGCKLTVPQVQRIRNLALEGWTMTQISNECGCSRSQAWKLARGLHRKDVECAS